MNDTTHPAVPPLKSFASVLITFFNQTKYQRLAGIAVAHLYSLRKATPYLRQRYTFEKPAPKLPLLVKEKSHLANGESGFIRIDTVHPGDQDKQKGVYHINAVDEVTQFEVVCTAPKISEQYLVPATLQLLNCFPFVIRLPFR